MYGSNLGRSLGVAAFGMALALCLAAPAAAQSLPGGSGVDYYPSWMLDSDPWIAGRDQDYDPLPGSRFDSPSDDFSVWRAERRSLFGPDQEEQPAAERDRDDWIKLPDLDRDTGR